MSECFDHVGRDKRRYIAAERGDLANDRARDIAVLRRTHDKDGLQLVIQAIVEVGLLQLVLKVGHGAQTLNDGTCPLFGGGDKATYDKYEECLLKKMGKPAYIGDVLSHAILPALTLGLLTAGIFLRLVRTNVIGTYNMPYIDAAQASVGSGETPRGAPEGVEHFIWGATASAVAAPGTSVQASPRPSEPGCRSEERRVGKECLRPV